MRVLEGLAFDSAPIGILIVDPSGCIVRANVAANVLLRGPVLLADGSRLEHFLRFRMDTRRIERITCDGAWGHALFEPRDGVTIVYIVCARCPAVFLDPALRDLYGLTAQERRLAILLYEGAALPEAAQSIGIELSTARSHLKNIFAKTQTRRQTQLVRVLASCAAVAASPPNGGCGNGTEPRSSKTATRARTELVAKLLGSTD